GGDGRRLPPLLRSIRRQPRRRDHARRDPRLEWSASTACSVGCGSLTAASSVRKTSSYYAGAGPVTWWPPPNAKAGGLRTRVAQGGLGRSVGPARDRGQAGRRRLRNSTS